MSESARIYCRVRPIFSWENPQTSVAVKNAKSLINKTKRGSNQYAFTHVFDPSADNKTCFDRICTPLIDNVIDGHNAILIAYGQTGSGKTHSLVGKPKDDVLGLLPRTLNAFMQAPDCTVQLGVVEAYGVHVARIELFDLFSESSVGTWDQKNGNGMFQMKNAQCKTVDTMEACADLIEEAHTNSHWAPTAKNPESSRGHTIFIIKVKQMKDGGASTKESFFLVADLAGSEGESAITPEFVKNNNPTTVMIRRLEAGCINAGLMQLQLIFAELKKKGKLSKVVGNGLRRMLHPYINTNTHISVLFTVAPTVSNSTITESTLKFAVQAGMVKVSPVAAKSKKNIAKFLKELEMTVAEQENIIAMQQNQLEEKAEVITELENVIQNMQNNPQAHYPEIGGASSLMLQHPQGSHNRTKTKEQADELFSMLKDEIEDILLDDDDLPPSGMHINFDAPGGSDEEEEVAADPGGDPLPPSAAARMRNRLLSTQKTEEMINKEVMANTHARGSVIFEQNLMNLIMDTNTDDAAAPAVKVSGVASEDNGYYQGGMEEDSLLTDEVENLDKENLIDFIEALRSMVRDKEIVCQQYKEQQIVMMDHLAQTNENLFHFFKIKYKVPGEKKKVTGVVSR